jgi:acyl-CoA dehydrogenase
MSDMREEMLRTLDRIVEGTLTMQMREAADERGNEAVGERPAGDPTQPLWSALEEAGITGIGAGGGDDVSFADAMELVRRAGYHGLPVPMVETVFARRILGRCGIEAPEGAISVVPPGAGHAGPGASGDFGSGSLQAVPFGRSARFAVAAGPEHVHLLDVTGALAGTGCNIAGEQRDRLDLARAKTVAKVAQKEASRVLEAEGALMRAIQISGAMSAALDHALTWVNDRIQFGRPIAKHQAVQHLMALLAEETAAAAAAADLAIAACEGGPQRLPVAIAKSRAGEAAGKGANIVHALFGAMGFTREHALHYSTRRLWSWRNEFGSEVYWQTELGKAVALQGGRRLWPFLNSEL